MAALELETAALLLILAFICYKLLLSPWSFSMFFIAIFTPIFTLIAFSYLAMVNVGLVFSPICTAYPVGYLDSFCKFVAEAQRLPTTGPAANGLRPLAVSLENGPSSIRSLDITKAYIVIDDMNAILRHYEFARSLEFAYSMQELGTTASNLGDIIQAFGMKAGGAFDRIDKAFDRIGQAPHDGSFARIRERGCGMFRLSQDNVLCPPPASLTLNASYENAFATVRDEFDDLLELMPAIIEELNRVDGILRIVVELAHGEEHEIYRAKQRLSTSVWSILGYNAFETAILSDSILTLKDLVAYVTTLRDWVAMARSTLNIFSLAVSEMSRSFPENGQIGRRNWMNDEESLAMIKVWIGRLRNGAVHEGSLEHRHNVDATSVGISPRQLKTLG